MGAFRWLGVFLILLLLLSPKTESLQETEEKPVLVVVQDNSSSVLLNKDSSYYQNDYPLAWERFVRKLEGTYTVNSFLYGASFRNGIRPDFSDEETDLSQVFRNLFDRYYKRNVGAVVVAGDGIYNKGSDPIYLAEKLGIIPVYAVALGDTTRKTDALIKQVDHNKTAYLGNEFPIEVLVSAKGLTGSKTDLVVSYGGDVIKRQTVTYEDDNFLNNFPFTIEAARPGLHKYTIELVPVEGEFTEENNRQDIYIEVISNKLKVLILADAPHPDLGAMRRVIESTSNYEVEIALADDFTKGAEGYNLFIMHQIPSRRHRQESLIVSARNKNIPVLFILGARSDFGILNRMNAGISVQGFRNSFDVVTASLAKDYDAFLLSEETRKSVREFSPIHSPFATYNFAPSVRPLVYQQLGRVVKDLPLVPTNNVNGWKTGFITGEGIWGWSLNQPEAFKELFGKLVQYLATREDRSFFRIYHDDAFNENQPVIFEAEVYNESYELITSPEVRITLNREEDGKEFPFDFQVSGNHFRLDAGRLDPGTYSYTAIADRNGQTFTKKGEFIVRALRTEGLRTHADHGLMYGLTAASTGAMYYPEQLDALADELLQRDDIVSVVYQEKTYEPIIDWRWVCFLIVACFAIEWFLRKRFGAY